MRKNPHDKILKKEPKKQHLSTVPKSCSSENSYAVTLPLSTSVGATMNFTKSALGLTMIASIRKPQLEPNHAVLVKSHSLKSCKLVSLCIPCKQLRFL